MAQELSVAMKTAKDIEKQLVVSENRLAYVQDEVKRLTQSRESIQAEIAKKTADYDVHIALRDSESKKIRKEASDAQDQMSKDKAEFQTILSQFQKDKAAFEYEKNNCSGELAKIKAQQENIRQFVISVQRAITVLGL